MNISTFIEKNRIYVRVGFVVLLLALMCFIGLTGGNDPMAGVYRDYTDQKDNEELNQLLEAYYKAYSSGDTNSLEKIASPISDKEKDYIKTISKYIKFYDIDGVYTKPGVNRDDLLTSVKVGVHYKNLKIVAPGLDFFYIEKKNGKYQINNLYSTFNNQNGELDVDPTIIAMIAAFEQQEDVLALQGDVSQAFSRISMEDKDFNVYFSKTLPEAVTGWASGYKEKAAKAEKKEKAREKKEEVKDQKKDKSKEAAAAKSKTDKKSETAKKASEKKSATDHSKKESVRKTGHTTAKVNVRKKPSTDARSLGKAEENTKFIIYQEKKGWRKVIFQGDEGWIHSDYLKLDSKKSKKESADSKKEKASTSSKKEKASTSSKKEKKANADEKKTTKASGKSSSKKKKTGGKTEKSVAKQDVVYVTSPVKIRESADESSKSLGKVGSGLKLKRYRQKGDWSKISYQGKKGWIKTESLTTKAPKKKKEPKENKKAKIQSGQVIRLSEATNIRKSMSTSAGRIGLAYKGETISVVKVYKNGWTKVTYDGKEGYIKTELLE